MSALDCVIASIIYILKTSGKWRLTFGAVHSVSVVHGDITGANILIDEGGRVRLINFGLSIIVRPILGQSHLAATSIHPGAIRYAAPELVLSDDACGLPLEKTDIYSFGCVMLQILSGRLPWSEIKSEKPELRILMMIAEGHGPQRPDGYPVIRDSDWDIIQRCLLPKPERRSSADEVLNLACARTQPRNFVIFGEMGVGKSALVNLIAGTKLAETSSGAQCCTLESTEYPVTFSDSRLTVGLNSPTMNNAGYLDALVNAHELVVSLKSRGGVHGLLFCIRAGRISTTIQQNYRLFFEFLCQEQVPLALVVTCLENEPNMDNCWTMNKGTCRKIPALIGLRGCGTRSRQKMLQMLMRRCKLRKEDAIQLLQRIEADEKWLPA
ncbi:kinase-like domain-containing protein [Suillus occidentalis]|nr:kinase-like domain-containing protein [Suillus occidentalis]